MFIAVEAVRYEWRKAFLIRDEGLYAYAPLFLSNHC